MNFEDKLEMNYFATFCDKSRVAVFFFPLMDTRSITLMGNPFFSFTSNNYFFSGSSDDLKQSKEMISYIIETVKSNNSNLFCSYIIVRLKLCM